MRSRPVLVIDNDAEAIKVIADNLKPLGLSVISAATGEEGLNAAKNSSPALILINLAVPGTEGLAICKSFISIIDTPIVLLTLRDGKYDPRYKSQYGIVDFVKKPISPRDLTYKVNKYADTDESQEDTMAVAAFQANALEMAEEDEAIEMVEEQTPAAVEAVEALPDDDVAEAVEAIPAYELDEESGAEEADEWAVPDEDVSVIPLEEEAPAWDMAAAEREVESAAEDEVPDWSMEEEPSPTMDEPAFDEAEEEPFELEDLEEAEEDEPFDEEQFEESPAEKPEPADESFGHGADLFDDEPSPGVPDIDNEESFAVDEEGKYDFPEDGSEFEVRPAALERAKRRKSKTRIFLPLLILLLVAAIAGGAYFVFIEGNGLDSITSLFKSSTPVAKKAEPVKPAEQNKPEEKQATTEETPAPPATEKKPAPRTASKKPTRMEKRPASPKTTQPSTTAATGKTYYVQFGAFRSKTNATKFQTQLKEFGYDTFLKELTVSEKPLYLVLLTNSFKDKWTAFKQARQIKETSDIGTSVHSE